MERSKSDQLIFGEFRDTLAQGLGKQGLHAQPFFEANDAILDFERVDT
jgi:hypothetical protein